MNHNAKLIVFDWDGTIMDSVGHIVDCLQAAITDLQLPTKTPDELKNIIGLGLREALYSLYPQATNDELVSLTAQYREHFFDQDHQPCELFSGARELIESLHTADYHLAVATGKGRQGLNKVLKETGLEEYFTFTRCADETHSKPHPQMLLDIMNFYGVKAHETIMIGDTEYDLQMANNAATASIAVSYGVHEKERLLSCNPVACVDNINELHQWLLTDNAITA